MTALLREVIGDVLRRARTSHGRTLREVSDSARVSLGYLSEVERGRKEASSELLNAICQALDVPLPAVLLDAGEQLAATEPAPVASVPRNRVGVPPARGGVPPANIDAGTKVVIPPAVSLTPA
jgi:transcriptional regulator with XRE-family HTH domain